MKKHMINSIVLIGGLTVAILFASACNVRNQEPTVQQQQVQYTCPMHPEVISDEPGNCPICGMALVETGNNNSEMMMHQMSDSTNMMHDPMMSDSTGH